MDQNIIKQLEKLLAKALINVATKNDLKNFATKDDLNSFATKDDLNSFATKDDLNSFATKDDLNSLEQRLHEKIKYDMDNVVVQIGGIVDNRKADKSIVEDLQKRVIKIESKLTS
ncbi:MAG TPA: hypothetical protein VLF93_06015 [Candidatus Saccharimonadales bacterium]|nr:hypothetical protein [Candidatus Saccharimonadales bacterium]